ncbi:hypothetical protein ACIQM4_24180 [Streptomyces sp. NPDC091272]|uniref:hypothetical protein n=1 Tax=Streptomyces sp. NPDC091272 TaxID=3365981 RepID=UPI00380A20F4
MRVVPRRWRGRGNSRTRRLLELHMVAAGLLGALAVTLLLVSYADVHREVPRLREVSAPAVREVVAVRLALTRAQTYAEKAQLGGALEANENYPTQRFAAEEGLSQLAAGQIAGKEGERTLGTLRGLLGRYTESMGQGIWGYDDLSLTRRQKMTEGRTILTRGETGIVDRLTALQRLQLAQVARDTGTDPAQHVVAGVAEAALLGTGVTLVSAWAVLRRRCGRRFSRSLAGGLLLVLLLAVLPPLWTSSTQRALDGARERLNTLESRAAPGRAGALADPDLAQLDVKESVREIDGGLADAYRRAPYVWGVGAAGLAMVALPLCGLGRRLWLDYWKVAP